MYLQYMYRFVAFVEYNYVSGGTTTLVEGTMMLQVLCITDG